MNFGGILIAGIIAVGASSGLDEAASTPLADFRAAYRRSLTQHHCAGLAPDRHTEGVRRERRRYLDILAIARQKGLAAELQAVEAEWRETDARVDRICPRQARRSPQSTAALLHLVNDEILFSLIRL